MPIVLTLELTENALFADVEAAARALRSLRSLGVRIAIDDFGTGYSSLAYLQQFPVDVLKIDRSFIVGLLDPTRPPTIVRMIVELSHSLGAITVAEGIEEWEQVRRLREVGCALGQGYLFARPLAAADVEQTLATAGCDGSVSLPRAPTTSHLDGSRSVARSLRSMVAVHTDAAPQAVDHVLEPGSCLCRTSLLRPSRARSSPPVDRPLFDAALKRRA
jgi:hypothetical protein